MTIGLHNLHPARGSRKKYKRTGRGNAGKGGTTAGRGTKGQKSRSGVSGLKRLGMKRIMLAIPKLGGFRSIKIRPSAVTLQDLARAFPGGGEVDLRSLKSRGLVHRDTSSAKIIGAGTVKQKFVVKGIAVSSGAKKSIESAGGSVS